MAIKEIIGDAVSSGQRGHKLESRKTAPEEKLVLRRSTPKLESRCQAVLNYVQEHALSKKLKLKVEEIRPLVRPWGDCFASDKITVEGHAVGLMYREKSDFDSDSGWRFLAGNETPEYMSDPANFAVYPVNVVANCDSSIVHMLEAATGSAFYRPAGSGTFERIDLQELARTRAC